MIHIIRNFTIATLLLFFIVLHIQPQWVDGADKTINDMYTKLHQKSQTPTNITIIDISDSTLSFVGEWPWPRQTLANLIQQIFETQNPKAIGLDILFPENSQSSSDQSLVELVSKYPICISQAFEFKPSSLPRQIGHLSHPQTEQQSPSLKAQGYVGNYLELAMAAQCSGHITPITDNDGMIRHIPASIEFNNTQWPSLAEAVLLTSQMHYTPMVQNNEGISRIPYPIAADHFQVIPLEEVVFGALPTNTLKDHLVLIGSSAAGLSDRVPTPIHPWLPGVMIHAEMLYAMQHQQPKPWKNITLISFIFGIISTLILITALTKNRLGIALLTFAVAMIGWLTLAFFAWIQHSDFSPSIIPIILIATLALMQPIQWRLTTMKNMEITELFKGYLSPELVDRLINTTDSTIRPQLKPITVLFADIDGFTELSKTMSTQALATLTREILGELTAAIQETEGTLDKYIGDEVMAFWNAPFNQPNHVEMAYHTANLMLKKIENYNLSRPEQPNIQIKIGIDTGTVLVGDLGTRFRHSYTAIGQTVNHANKLYSFGKRQKKSITITPNVLKHLPTNVLQPNTLVIDYNTETFKTS